MHAHEHARLRWISAPAIAGACQRNASRTESCLRLSADKIAFGSIAFRRSNGFANRWSGFKSLTRHKANQWLRGLAALAGKLGAALGAANAADETHWTP